MQYPLTRIAAALLAAYALPAAAQSRDAESPQSAQSSESEALTQVAQRLSPITVEGHEVSGYKPDRASSSKFTAPLLDTPRSVTVVTEDVLRDTAATSLQDALRNVPGITFGAGEGGQPIADRPIIRGINSTSNVFVDGLRDIGTQTREVFALEAVEITNGADSVYAGRGTGGGSINLVTKTPKPEAFTRGTLMIGTSDTLRGTLDQNWVVGESSAVRLNVMGSRGDTPGRDNAVDYQKWGIAPSLAFGLGSPTRVMFSYYHLSDEGMPDYSIPYDLDTGLPVTETMGVDSESFYGLNSRDFRESETDIGTLIAERDLVGGRVLRNITRYGKSLNSYVVTNPDDSKGNVANGYVYRNTKSRWTETENFANQTDLSGEFDTGAIGHRYNVGLEFSREKKTQDGWTVTSAGTGTGTDCSDPVEGPLLLASGDCTSLYDPNPADPWQGSVTRNNTPTHYTTDVTGLYAFDTITFTPQWLANVGLRWDRYETEAEKPTDPTVNGVARDVFLNYQAALMYKPVESGTIYVSYSTASTPAALGTSDEDAAFPGSPDDCTRRCRESNLDLEPEETTNIELGTKWDLFDQRLLLTAAVFDTTRENASIEVAAGVFEQAGETRVRGVEVSATGSITDAWQVFGGYTFLDSELVKGAYDSAAEGEVLTNTPENSFSLFTTYQVLPAFSVGGGAYYVDEVYGSTSATPTKKVPDYWRFDAMASLQLDDGFDLQLNVLNLTDEVYYTKAYTAHYAALGPGRQILVSANFSF